MPVIYLTGAPASGKTTLSRHLKKAFPELIVFAYGEQLRDHIAAKCSGPRLGEEDVRRLSAQLVTPADIQELDGKLIDLVRSNRDSVPILIDSHPVTKEVYGFRVTGFTTENLGKLNPDVIVCLYTSSDVTVNRIATDPMGRPQITDFEAAMHTHLQTSTAIQYGILLAKPVYLIDSAVDQEELVGVVAAKTRLRV